MPRTVYRPNSGAFEVFATEDEIQMENLRKNNQRLKAMLDQAEFTLSRIETAMSRQGIEISSNAVDLDSLSASELNDLAKKLNVNPGPNKSATISNIVINATPYEIWKAYDNSQQ